MKTRQPSRMKALAMTLAGALAALALILLATVGMVWLALKIINFLKRICPPEPPPPVAGDTNNPNQYVFYYYSDARKSGWAPPLANASTQYWTVSCSSCLQDWEPVMGWCGTEEEIKALLRRILATQQESGYQSNCFWKAVAQ